MATAPRYPELNTSLWNYTGMLLCNGDDNTGISGSQDFRKGLRLFLNNRQPNVGYEDGTANLPRCATLRNDVGDLRVVSYGTGTLEEENVGLFIQNTSTAGIGIIVDRSTGNVLVN